MSARSLKVGLGACLVALSVGAFAQQKPQAPDLASAIQELRTRRLMPLSTPPSYDWQRIQSAYSFAHAHANSIDTTLKTTFILSLLAGKDTESVVVYTGKLSTDYNRRMKQTIDWMNEVLATPKDKANFAKKNYKRSVDLGLMHLDMSQAVKIKWNPSVRVPGSQEAFAYMLYALVWQPIEKMITTHEVDPVKDAKSIDDWLYLWHILGYGMGLDARLLPTNARQAADVVHMLRASQYPGPGDEVPHAVRDLIRNEMDFLYLQQDNGRPIDDPTKLEIRKKLAAEISYSPGLSEALGLGKDPLQGLQELTDTID